MYYLGTCFSYSVYVLIATYMYVLIVLIVQATIGIDFLSKTMYLEDRTVSLAQ